MPEYVYWIIYVAIVLLYLFIGLVCFGSYGWAIGRPYRHTWRDKIIGGLWDWSFIIFWPILGICILVYLLWFILEHIWVVFKRRIWSNQ